MNSPYVRINDLSLQDEDQRLMVETLLLDIHALEEHLMRDEVFMERLKSQVGDEYASQIGNYTVENTKRILLGLKIAFWYYTGVAPHKVLMDPDPDYNLFDNMGF